MLAQADAWLRERRHGQSAVQPFIIASGDAASNSNAAATAEQASANKTRRVVPWITSILIRNQCPSPISKNSILNSGELSAQKIGAACSYPRAGELNRRGRPNENAIGSISELGRLLGCGERMTQIKPTLSAETGSTEITRFNALRHGVLSRYTVLPWEDADEYRALVASLAAEHAPQGPTEIGVRGFLLTHCGFHLPGENLQVGSLFARAL
jgi:hypothetical protein